MGVARWLPIQQTLRWTLVMEEVTRNFRRTYYKSLGVNETGGSLVGELEEYLKSEIIDVEQLKQFCLKASLPVFYRPHIWKLILNAEPVHKDQDTREFIMSQRSQQYRDLEHALCVLTMPSSSADKPDMAVPNTLVYMYCLGAGCVGAVLRDTNLYRNLCAMTTPFIDTYTNKIDLYFTYSGFVSQWQLALEQRHLLNTQFDSELNKRSADLHHHLVLLGAFSSIPLQRWFGQCFASDLPPSAREILWDRVVGGSCSIVVYVALAILLLNSRSLMQAKQAQEVANLLDKLSENDAPLFVKHGIEMWEESGSPLTP